MRKHFDNDGACDKVCLTLLIARSNIQTGDGKYFLLVKHSALIMMWVALIPLTHALSLRLLWLCERRKELETEQERERERDGAREGAS